MNLLLSLWTLVTDKEKETEQDTTTDAKLRPTLQVAMSAEFHEQETRNQELDQYGC